jgi:fructose 5-dehydrogenase cytochrome subunit
VRRGGPSSSLVALARAGVAAAALALVLIVLFVVVRGTKRRNVVMRSRWRT